MDQAEALKTLKRRRFFSFVFELVGDIELNGLLKNLPVVSCEEDCNKNEKSKQSNDRNQADLLLLLRHAHKCGYTRGLCPITPFCRGVQLLWAHLMNCRVQKCTVSHCGFSKRVLHHFLICPVKLSCNVCGPMHEAMKRNLERYSLKLLCLQCGDKA